MTFKRELKKTEVAHIVQICYLSPEGNSSSMTKIFNNNYTKNENIYQGK